MMDYAKAKVIFEKNMAAFRTKFHRGPNPFEKAHLIPQLTSESASMQLMVEAMEGGKV